MTSKLADALKVWQAQYEKPRPRSIYALCPPAIRLGQDQYRCQKCSMVWDTDEPKPPCGDATATEQEG